MKVCVEKNMQFILELATMNTKKLGRIKVIIRCYKLSNLITKVNCPSEEKMKGMFKENTILVGMLNPSKNKDQIDKIIDKKIKPFALELLPKITRAQSMDVLSSQSNLAGYRAVVDYVAEFEKAVPDDDSCWNRTSC